MSQELVDLLFKYDVPVPRYTSYPTAPVWGSLESSQYAEKLKNLKDSPIALYFHIPFCQSMCLFCACSVILNRKPENEERYIEYLCKEVDLVADLIGVRKKVSQLHFGGGTPTKISLQLFKKLYNKILDRFDILPDAEIAIEVDPRTVAEDEGEKLNALKALGFNRVSFGVQDTNEIVQEAIRRRQSLFVTTYTYEMARKLGFPGINIDLIYGLPKQTIETFTETIEKIIQLRPDRLALFSYAKVPWLKGHQKAIPDSSLPTTNEKFGMYVMARKKLIESGYRAIGMDHFALSGDELSKAYEAKRLQRNFQGYTVLDVDDLIGFGVTSIGFVNGCYIQNVKELSEYYAQLDAHLLAVAKGKELTEDDHIRRWVIQRLMCDFRLNKQEFQELFGISFDSYFVKERKALQDSLVTDSEQLLQVHPDGELFIRNISAVFDWYLAQNNSHKSFSRAI